MKSFHVKEWLKLLCGLEVEIGPAGGSYHKVCAIRCRPLSVDTVERIRMLESLILSSFLLRRREQVNQESCA